jgi:agmatine deiminase
MTVTLKSTPAQNGFRMPGEFEPHGGTWMLWPERPDNWRENAKPAQQTFTELAATIARFEPVSMGVSPAHFKAARSVLPPQIRVIEMTHDDCWMRDVGPTCVINAEGTVRGVDWHFNAWGGLQGGLYSPWDQDELVTSKVLEIERWDRYDAPFINEGGAVHVDGEGTVLVTEECLLNKNRNPRLSRAQTEARLKAYLGVSKVVWLGKGVFNDETDGHIDELACFVRPGEICLTWTDDKRDPQYAISLDAWERLHDERDAKGRRFKVHKLPMPGPLFMTRKEASGIARRAGTKPRCSGERLAASYVNFYIVNGAIVMPRLDPRTDRTAAARLKQLFPRRRVVGVRTREILLGGGNIHCVTQQMPATRAKAGPS